jgi:hypothetical protein
MAALRRFDAAGKRRITFEYVMIAGVNDDPELVPPLASLAGEVGAHVNLIPYNPIPGPDWRPTPPAGVRAFADALGRLGVNVTVREPRGRDIDAACGQLRAKALKERGLPIVGGGRGGAGSRVDSVRGEAGSSHLRPIPPLTALPTAIPDRRRSASVLRGAPAATGAAR